MPGTQNLTSNQGGANQGGALQFSGTTSINPSTSSGAYDSGPTAMTSINVLGSDQSSVLAQADAILGTIGNNQLAELGVMNSQRAVPNTQYGTGSYPTGLIVNNGQPAGLLANLPSFLPIIVIGGIGLLIFMYSKGKL